MSDLNLAQEQSLIEHALLNMGQQFKLLSQKLVPHVSQLILFKFTSLHDTPVFQGHRSKEFFKENFRIKMNYINSKVKYQKTSIHKTITVDEIILITGTEALNSNLNRAKQLCFLENPQLTFFCSTFSFSFNDSAGISLFFFKQNSSCEWRLNNFFTLHNTESHQPKQVKRKCIPSGKQKSKPSHCKLILIRKDQDLKGNPLFGSNKSK